jgi:putative tryptophan/tyrosine transport system substrate-binding protein
MALVMSLGCSAVMAQTVVILSTDSLTATNRTVSGARSMIKERQDAAVIQSILLSSEPQKLAAEIEEVRALKPTLIMTVGSSATQIAKDNFTNLPIIFAAVKYPVISGFAQSVDHPGGNITGASLDIPVDIQLRYLSQIIPKLKRVGVLYTSNTAKLISPARVIAGNMGIELVAIEIATQRDLPRALDSLASCTQALWSVADQNLFDPQTTKFILLNSLRMGLPFMGFSRHVVESGALFALDFDYKAIGRQAGQIAIEVIQGASPAGIPVSTPDIIWFHYNENTAKRVGVSIPPELMAIAKEVYR